ncbi:MAG: hypothetical protein K8R89_06910, partial [Anaerolineae bacterium]|nr:hypothetical protein [Anaerolineae bacterium]
PYGGIIDDNGRPEDSSNWTDPHNHYLLTGKEWDEENRRVLNELGGLSLQPDSGHSIHHALPLARNST